MKQPHRLFDTVFAFPPNRDTLGGTSYFLKTPEGNVLIDCPNLTEETRSFLEAEGGVRWFFMTHRTGKGKAREVQVTLDCEVLIQEQEAYLLPKLAVTTFRDDYRLTQDCRIFWTPGHSPGSSCLYDARHGGILFSGRHLLPDQAGHPKPLRVAKTFHWPRQVRYTQKILEEFSPETLHYICPGANTGFLRGRHVIDRAYEKLMEFDAEEHLAKLPGF